MNSAKENYALGKQRTITVDIAEQIYFDSIGSRSEKFVCPECGEYLAFVRRYELKSYFKHGKKNETTKDCDLRSSNQTYNSLYERLGLPMYLRKYSDGQYELCIGFYKLENSIFNRAEADKLRISIKNPNESIFYKQEVSYYVDRSNFSTETMTLLKIDFISSRYFIYHSLSNYGELITPKWGNFVEGILQAGALFTCSENGGRKININDEITTDSEYFCLCRNENLLSMHSEIERNFCGNVSLGDNGKIKGFSIYRIKFKPQDDYQFQKLYKFCRDHFKVSLLFRPASLIPIWPPVVLKDNYVACTVNDDNLFLLKNDDIQSSKIFLHDGSDYKEIQGTEINYNTRLLEINASPDEDLAITINERYNAISALVHKFNDSVKTYQNSIIISDIENNSMEKGSAYKLPIKKSIKIASDSRSYIIHKRGHQIKKFKINDFNPIILRELAFGDEITAIADGRYIPLVTFIEQKEFKNKISYDKLNKQLMKLDAPFVATPPWIKIIINSLFNHRELKKTLWTYLVTNKIPLEATRLLKKELLYQLKDGKSYDNKIL